MAPSWRGFGRLTSCPAGPSGRSLVPAAGVSDRPLVPAAGVSGRPLVPAAGLSGRAAAPAARVSTGPSFRSAPVAHWHAAPSKEQSTGVVVGPEAVMATTSVPPGAIDGSDAAGWRNRTSSSS